MKIDEALYQLKQNIKMHEIEGTTSNQNEREKVLLNYINKQKEVLNKIKEYINRTEINSVGTPLAYTEIGKELLELLEEIE